ncbi:MAG: sigma-70 family RNA polymerase sigma factor [Jatrophihabitantaceae bacterium]
MPRAASPYRGSEDPEHGLRVLARLVNEALLAIGAQPALAVAGPAGTSGSAGLPEPAGPLAAQMAVDVSSALQRAGRRGASGAPGRAGTDSGTGSGSRSDADGVDEEHAEVWQQVTLAQSGDGEAFGRLYDRYVDSVYRYIYYRVNDRALAEDFTSETFLRALRRIGSISYQGRDIGAWFVTIARNIVLDHVKSARHRLEVTTADTPEGHDRAAGPEAAVIESLTNERLMAAVNQLGDEQRECVMLRFIQGFSVSETASVMGKNDGAIKALQHRAVRKLAELVGTDLR